METIPHRELRNSSSEILRRVAAGETFEITNKGEVAAVLSPPQARNKLEELRAAGMTRPAQERIDPARLKKVEGVTSRQVLEDLRGER